MDRFGRNSRPVGYIFCWSNFCWRYDARISPLAVGEAGSGAGVAGGLLDVDSQSAKAGQIVGTKLLLFA